MARAERNFTYTIKYVDSKKGVQYSNKQVVRAKGYGQSWFATEEAARESLEMKLNDLRECWFVTEILEWYLSNRDGIIERG